MAQVCIQAARAVESVALRRTGLVLLFEGAAAANGMRLARLSTIPARDGQEAREVSLSPSAIAQITQMPAVAQLSEAQVHAISRLAGRDVIPAESSLALFPVRALGRLNGFVAVGAPSLGDELSTSIRQVVEHVGTAQANAARLHDLDGLGWGTLRALAQIVDAASPWTEGHSERVARRAAGLAEHLGLPRREVEFIHRGGLLHDIGKLHVPLDILDKPDRLTPEEFRAMQEHVTLGAAILEPLGVFEQFLPLVRHHHERFDGHGYPDGLEGGAIPLPARILAVADAFDALTSDRPYRAALPRETALRIITEQAGLQFDAEIARAFVGMIEQEDESNRPEPAVRLA